MITADDVAAAHHRLAGRVRRTPVLEVDAADLAVAAPGAAVVLKLEQLQHTGSFKARGALNAVLAAREGGAGPTGVVAASGGNHGLAVAHAAREAGLPAVVFVPTTSPAVKVSPIEIVPWLCKPITSPGQAHSTISRSEAMKVSAFAIRTSLPLRTWSIFMPAS